jgi:transforming growth factor beta, invertebrate
MSDKSNLPTTIEEAILNIFLTNNLNSDNEPETLDQLESEAESDYDDSSSGSDLSTKKVTFKSSTNSIYHRQSHLRHHSHNRKSSIGNSNSIRLHVYEHESDSQSRILLLEKDIKLPFKSNDNEEAFKLSSYNQWIQLDVTSIIRTWLRGEDKTFSVDIYCEMCSKYSINIVNKQHGNDEASQKNNPTLNVIGAVVRAKRKTGNKQEKQNNRNNNKKDKKHRKTYCRTDGEKKCCRHKWVIDFKEMGGYEHIIHPRHFDAGFCEGTCPFRHNTGNNHAYFQSLAHHQLGKDNVPNVCCAPSRLTDLEVLHLDEEDPTKLKVTTMKKMQAIKCSCT